MCYLVPAGSAIVTSLIWRKKKEARTGWLNLMFCGGAIFGIVDHLWNGELFTSGDIVRDLSLGAVISLSILVSWGIMLVLNKPKLAPAR